MYDNLIESIEVMKMLKIKRNALSKWIKKKLLPSPIRIGRKNFWKKEELEEWLENKWKQRD